LYIYINYRLVIIIYAVIQSSVTNRQAGQVELCIYAEHSGFLQQFSALQ